MIFATNRPRPSQFLSKPNGHLALCGMLIRHKRTSRSTHFQGFDFLLILGVKLDISSCSLDTTLPSHASAVDVPRIYRTKHQDNIHEEDTCGWEKLGITAIIYNHGSPHSSSPGAARLRFT